MKFDAAMVMYVHVYDFENQAIIEAFQRSHCIAVPLYMSISGTCNFALVICTKVVILHKTETALASKSLLWQ